MISSAKSICWLFHISSIMRRASSLLSVAMVHPPCRFRLLLRLAGPDQLRVDPRGCGSYPSNQEHSPEAESARIAAIIVATDPLSRARTETLPKPRSCGNAHVGTAALGRHRLDPEGAPPFAFYARGWGL